MSHAADALSVAKADLTHALDQPVLKTDFLKDPVTVKSIELLKNGRTYIVRTRSSDGAEAITVPNSNRVENLYPLLLNQIITCFVNQDARKLESLLWDSYRHRDNYKYQGMALWICTMAVETALLELMGKTAKRPVADSSAGACAIRFRSTSPPARAGIRRRKKSPSSRSSSPTPARKR